MRRRGRIVAAVTFRGSSALLLAVCLIGSSGCGEPLFRPTGTAEPDARGRADSERDVTRDGVPGARSDAGQTGSPSPSSSPSSPHEKPPVVHVEGDAARYDLGNVPPESVHRVRFVIRNADRRPLAIRRIASDCECIETVDPPESIPAGGEATVVAKFTAPKALVPYETRLMLLTDRDDRRVISLVIKARMVEQGEGNPTASEDGGAPEAEAR